MNMPSILILILLLVIILLAARKMLRDKKQGKSCSCGCSGCAYSGSCQKPERERTDPGGTDHGDPH